VTPEEIVITRNTSEGNNLVSSGIELSAGDEVVVHDENHPTNLTSWQNKARRFGFTVKTVSIPTPPPSVEALIKPFVDALTSKTKVLAFTHVTSSFGSQFPAKELCRIARERGILTLVDGAQSFGALDLDLKDIGCDFFTGSSHKWLMGPKEAGILYIRSDAQSRLWPSNYGVYGGTVGASRTFEQLGQRDDPTFMAMAEAVDFHVRIGKKKDRGAGEGIGRCSQEGIDEDAGRLHVLTNRAGNFGSCRDVSARRCRYQQDDSMAV
jgi:selenocysteine lyase/cysteine desulfurase